MQCSECGYISFKKEKACRSCGFKFKKTTQSSQSLAGRESFSIFAGATKVQIEDSPATESVGLLDEQEPSSFIDPETGDFNLDLSETSEETGEETPISSENTEYRSMEFGLDEDVELEEVEGLGLEPMHATESLEESEKTETAEVSLDTPIDSEEPTLSLEPVLEIGDPEETVSPEPVLEIGDPEETVSLEPVLEIGEPEETVSLEPVLEIGDPEETVSPEPVLDIGGPESEEVPLGIDDSPSIPPASPVEPAPLEEIELELEIDDSDGPLTIQSQDIPDIEIEDLGLELESSDDPEPEKP